MSFQTDREALFLVRHRQPPVSSTDDPQAISGREKCRRHEEVVDPAHEWYCRYCSRTLVLERARPASTVGSRSDQTPPATRQLHAASSSRSVASRYLATALLSIGCTCIWRPAAARLCLLLIFLLYRCSEEEDRRRRQKTLWLCLCMQMHDVFLAGTADTRGAMCLR
ncbi:hypothetical protein LI328DRAFT_158843 [Trichoderma asperelloides]|nr:hypothetical protein LI328DRAFT_158843 [Trichoderma asperelloides]